MAITAQWWTQPAGGPLITAVSGKQVRIQRIVAMAGTNSSFTLTDDSDVAILPPLLLRSASNGLRLEFVRVLPQTPIGSGVKINVGAGLPADAQIYIEYDRVPE